MNMEKMRLKLNLSFLDPLVLQRDLLKLQVFTRRVAPSNGSHLRMMEAVQLKNIPLKRWTVKLENGHLVEKLMLTNLNLNSTTWKLVKR